MKIKAIRTGLAVIAAIALALFTAPSVNAAGSSMNIQKWNGNLEVNA